MTAARDASEGPRAPADARKDGLVPLTMSDKAGAEVETVTGRRRWLDWCKAEADRIRKAGRTAEIVKDVDDKYALWVSPSPHLKPES